MRGSLFRVIFLISNLDDESFLSLKLVDLKRLGCDCSKVLEIRYDDESAFMLD